MADERFFTKRKKQLSLADIAQLTGARNQAARPESIVIEDVAPLNRAGEACVSFLDNIRYRHQLQTTQAGACFVTPDIVREVPDKVHALITETPYKAFALTSQAFYEQDAPHAYRAPGAQIHDDATVGENCFIGEFAVIGSGVQIGDNCWIMAGVSIDDNVIIGNNCYIHPHVSLTCALIGDGVTIFPGSQIGQDGFGFAVAPEGFIKIPQLGRVIVKDDVVIGANTTIDRGSGPDTIIGAGTWIDNLVQIGHNAEIGCMCVLAGQAGVSGSAKIGDRVMIGGKAGIAGHITIGNDARIAGNSGVMRDIEPGMEVMGSPALDKTMFMRQVTYLKRVVTNLAGKAKDQKGEDE